MADEKALVSMAQQFTGLPMTDLISGPLMAACEANNKMAMTQADYILKTGFSYLEKEDKGVKIRIYKPIEISMEMARPVILPGTDENGNPDPSKTVIEEVLSIVKVPLISVIPIPTLGIDLVDITFDMEVKSAYGEETSQESETKLGVETSFESKLSVGPFSVSVKGNVSYDETNKSSASSKFEKSNSAKYHVQVQATQQAMPKGLGVILDAFAQNMGPWLMPDGPEKDDELANPQLQQSGGASGQSFSAQVPAGATGLLNAA